MARTKMTARFGRAADVRGNHGGIAAAIASAQVIPWTDGLGFTVSPRGSAIPDVGDADERGRFESFQRLLNSYLTKFLPLARQLVVDGAIGKNTFETRNGVVAHMSVRGFPAQVVRSSPVDQANHVGVDALFISAGMVGQAVPRPATPPPPPVSDTGTGSKPPTTDPGTGADTGPGAGTGTGGSSTDGSSTGTLLAVGAVIALGVSAWALWSGRDR